MGAADNRELLDYYKDRKVWLVEPDRTSPKVSPYPEEAADGRPARSASSATPN
jgi:hypothetical protein